MKFWSLLLHFSRAVGTVTGRTTLASAGLATIAFVLAMWAIDLLALLAELDSENDRERHNRRPSNSCSDNGENRLLFHLLSSRLRRRGRRSGRFRC